MRTLVLNAGLNAYGVSKRILDVLFSSLGIVALSPVFIYAIIHIKLFSRGPLIFSQERVGRFGKPFRIYKFRTMRIGSEGIGTGSVTVKDDPRFFWGASILRKFKIDELPQLWNVVNGTMSLVGPRPTVEVDYVRMDERQKERFLLRPGLTGLAQINGGTALRWPERINYDLEYLQKISFLLDFSIILKTIFLVLAGKAESHPAGESEW